MEGRPLMGLTMGSQRQLRPRVRLYRQDGFRFHALCDQPLSNKLRLRMDIGSFCFYHHHHPHYLCYLQLILPAQLSGLAGDQTTGRELLAHLAAHLLHSYNKVSHPQLFSTATPAGPPCEGLVGQRAGLDLAGGQPRRVHQV